MSIVNDLNHSIESPCPVNVFGRRCREKDYQSWRKIAVSIRSTLLAGDYSGEPSVYGEAMLWLGEWTLSVTKCGMVPHLKAIDGARTEADPDMKSCARFPPSLPFWKATYTPEDPIIFTSGLYIEETDLLITYIREGLRILKSALASGAVDEDDKGTDLERAEQREEVALPRWAKYGLSALVFTGVAVFSVWAYSILRRPRE